LQFEKINLKFPQFRLSFFFKGEKLSVRSYQTIASTDARLIKYSRQNVLSVVYHAAMPLSAVFDSIL